MNTQIGRASGMAACRWIAAALIGASQVICPAHDQPVHEEIAGSAALSSSGLADFLSGNSSAQYLPFTTLPQLSFDNTDVSGPHSPVDWIKLGAFHEDDEARFGDHFYTVRPGRTAGAAEPMTDWHESIITPGNTVNSYVWATQAGLSGPYIPFKRHDQENTENWPHARIYQYAALTSPAKDARDANMAHLMYALGHVLHLN